MSAEPDSFWECVICGAFAPTRFELVHRPECAPLGQRTDLLPLAERDQLERPARISDAMRDLRPSA